MNNGAELKEKLFHKKINGWNLISEEEKLKIFDYTNSYIQFLNEVKTEREVVQRSIIVAKQNGFQDINEIQSLKSGDKVFLNNHDKSLYLALIGEEPLEKGLCMIGSHADSPRLDLKPNPLYEEAELAYFKTHYYGGIKKYQWTAIPLAIHGVIIKQNGERITINIGENERDPIFTITDLLPHLALEQMEKKLKEGIEGENLNLLIGSIPYQDKEITEKVKLNILDILNRKYGIIEADLISAELELVPAFKARSLGFDESLIAAYGQDDKACVFTSLTAMMELERTNKTAVCIISDKEEIGSMGNTGMESEVFDSFIGQLLEKTGQNKANALDYVFCQSNMLSADVDGGFDPIYASVYEKSNAAFLGYGVGINKYTGSKGKSGASDANAEYVADIIKMLNKNNISYQVSELGKVDNGGGGTIAYIMANKGVNVIDCGIPVFSMHSPYEVSSKYDVYMAYKTYISFWRQ